MNKKTDRELYEKYRLQWMIDHGKTLTDLFKAVGDDDDVDITHLFDSWERGGNGFNGEMWACFEEFKDCELAKAKKRNPAD